MTPTRFVAELATLRFQNTFNPYAEHCIECDVEDAASIRSQMLAATLAVAAEGPLDSIWIGRDLGYRGGRRTGLAFTDDVHLAEHRRRWGIDVTRPTNGKAVAERAATVVWNQLFRIEAPIFLWNAFPLHPHEPDKPFSNRKHSSAEGRAGVEILRDLLSLLRPKRLVAIGNDAEAAAIKLSTEAEVIKVRHPSYGGHPEFVRQIGQLYNLPLGTLI